MSRNSPNSFHHLKKIEKEHKVFGRHVEEAFALFESGNVHAGEKMAEKIEKEEDKLNHELEEALLELERFTAEAALEAEHIERRQLKILIILFGAVILVFLILAFFIARSITRPISRMTEDMKVLAEGDTSVEIAGAGNTNEIGLMASTVQVFKENMIETDRMREEQKQAEMRAEADKKKMMNELANSFEGRVQGVINTVASSATELSQASTHMAELISQNVEMAQSSTAEANEASGNVQSVAAAAEEMSATVGEISSQTHRSNELVANSVESVKSADEHAAALQRASEKVKEVVQLISDIAGQINLLALNATIESARAGEAGKGFAVVANEVKNLASQTDQSIQEIDVVIKEMNSVSEDIVTSLNEVRASVEKIADSSGGIASAVEEQSATTNEIAFSMQSAAQGTQNIADNLETVSTTSATANDSASQVSAAAQELSQQAETLDKEVRMFLTEIRGE